MMQVLLLELELDPDLLWAYLLRISCLSISHLSLKTKDQTHIKNLLNMLIITIGAHEGSFPIKTMKYANGRAKPVVANTPVHGWKIPVYGFVSSYDLAV
jgi:hypothetical protein